MPVLGQMEVVCLVCKETDSLYSGMAVQFYILTCRVWGIQFFTSLPEVDDTTMCFFFLNFSHSNRHAVISSLCLICMSLMVNNAEHLFMCLFAICILEVKCLFTSSTHSLTGLFDFLLLKFENSVNARGESFLGRVACPYFLSAFRFGLSFHPFYRVICIANFLSHLLALWNVL